MTRTDSLITGAIKAIKSARRGSAKTQHNHIQEAKRFTETLRQLGYGVRQWKNISNKHVGAVVNSWKAKGLATATMKEYLAGVRLVAAFFKNDRIAKDNSAFGIGKRVYVSNRDKSVPQAVYERVVADLKKSSDINDNRVAAQLQLQRELGLRKEEAFKFNPSACLLNDGRVLVHKGTKGGRERMILEVSERAKQAIDYAKRIVDGTNTMPNDKTEREWEQRFYRTLHRYGLTQSACGASSHGLRHAYAQERYAQITGFQPSVKFDSGEAFRENAERLAGDGWKKLDSDAREVLKVELGHGRDRMDVISQYIGRS